MIFHDEPTSWQDLENRVALIFSEMGFEVLVEETIDLIRGKKQVDVYAKERKQVPSHEYIVECKNYAVNVSQEKAHALRTVVADSGVSMGFLISKAGFQKGAYEAVEKTNIRLFNWCEFQSFFLDRWVGIAEEHLQDLSCNLEHYLDPSRSSKSFIDRYTDIYHLSKFKMLGRSLKTIEYPFKLTLSPMFKGDETEILCKSMKEYKDKFKCLLEEALSRVSENKNHD